MNKIVLQGKSSIEHYLKVEVMDNLMRIKFVFLRLGVRNEKRCQRCWPWPDNRLFA